MSFSSEVKQELAKQSGKSRHCQIAELAALVAFDGKRQWLIADAGDVLDSENPLLQEKYGLLLTQLFHVNIEEIDTLSPERVLETIKMWNQPLNRAEITDTVNGILLQQTCCRRAFIKGVFMTSGSISDPEKGYHFEVVCDNPERAELISGIIHNFDIDSKVIARKRYHVVYIKDGTMIVDMLNLMGAYSSLMDMENIRILKDIANNVNRKVNCEAANLNKTVNAAVRQIEDIEYIIKVKGIHYLPDNLVELAQARLEARDASLKELGEMINPPIGKSGVNHRLRKISEIADHLRGCR